MFPVVFHLIIALLDYTLDKVEENNKEDNLEVYRSIIKKQEEIKKKTTKACPKCKLLLGNHEYDDHLLCHSFEENNGNSNNVNQVTINYISSRNNIGNQNNFFHSSIYNP